MGSGGAVHMSGGAFGHVPAGRRVDFRWVGLAAKGLWCVGGACGG